MDDDFLYRICPQVRKTFADSLRQRLSHPYPDPSVQRKGVFLMNRSLARPLPWKFALAFLLVLVVLTFTFSGPVWAKAAEWIRSVAGFTLEERSLSPLQALGEGETGVDAPAPAEDVNAPDEAVVEAPAAAQPAVVATVPVVAWPEALANPPFSFGLPGWTPDGYVLDDQVGVANSQSWIMLSWNHAGDASSITLLVERDHAAYSLPVGEDSSEEVQVNGQPALLVRGNWDGQHQWDARRGIALYWTQDGRDYRLLYEEREAVHNAIRPIQGDMEVITGQLVRMAESIH